LEVSGPTVLQPAAMIAAATEQHATSTPRLFNL
jgi:hypothetical protein